MWSSTCMLVLSLAAAAFAQESIYTGPMFNPSEAAHFGSGSLVYPTQTTLPAIQPTNAFSMATTISGIILPTTLSRSSSAATSTSHSTSQSALSSRSSSASSTASSTVSSAVTSASTSAPAQQSTAAAVAKRAGVVGVVAGGLLAGLALA